MRKTDRFSFCLRLAGAALVGLLSAAAYAQTSGGATTVSSGVKSSIQTVDELIKIENAEVLAKSRPSGVIGTQSMVTKSRPSAPVIRVESIYGPSDALRIDLIVNGQPYDGLRLGAAVGSCVVREIANRCVVLAPATRRTASNMCPKACWTGEQVYSSGFGAGTPMNAPSRAGMPMPAPLPSGSIFPAALQPANR